MWVPRPPSIRGRLPGTPKRRSREQTDQKWSNLPRLLLIILMVSRILLVWVGLSGLPASRTVPDRLSLRHHLKSKAHPIRGLQYRTLVRAEPTPVRPSRTPASHIPCLKRVCKRASGASGSVLPSIARPFYPTSQPHPRFGAAERQTVQARNRASRAL